MSFWVALAEASALTASAVWGRSLVESSFAPGGGEGGRAMAGSMSEGWRKGGGEHSLFGFSTFGGMGLAGGAEAARGIALCLTEGECLGGVGRGEWPSREGPPVGLGLPGSMSLGAPPARAEELARGGGRANLT